MYEKIKLDYSYEDLEPIIDSETVYIHYNKHYQNYLNNLNKLLQEENYDYRYSKEDLVNNINIFNIDKEKIVIFRDDCAYVLAASQRSCTASARRPLQARHYSIKSHTTFG